ncbi:MAG TPA: PEP/pyruvate-binding domain-containing protein [Oculatellaceae cyanobacterium]
MLKTLTIFKFPGGPEATLAQVGGKGLSLIKSCESGMPVPPGFVLSVDFFTPWLERLKASPEWTAFSQATAEQMQAACSALKAATTGFTFTKEQREAIDEFFKDFEVDVLFAVRSSSPEEDLEGASFAGGYETILGVNKTSIENAVLRAFASCLDFRVAAYKREYGFDVSSPKIAVVVQRQIGSEVAGVGFSINPLTNNFDEAVINANFGLGETVVAGLATPDTFTVDRNARTVSNKQLGGKETSIWLGDNGGTIEKPAAQKDDFCLTDQQILELSDLIAKVEGIYGKPIDTEWALAGNQFYLLQARPITAYVPLAPNRVTNPGERKSLFLDVTIVVQGLYKPMSPMGTSVIARVLMAASEHVLGQNILGDPHKSVAIVQNGRIYANLSVLMAMFGRDKLAQVVEQMDPTSSQALCELDEQVYKAEKGAFSHPPFHLLMQLPEPILRLLESNLLPEHAHKSVDRAIANFMVETREHAQNDKSVLEVANDVIPAGFKFIFRHSMPLFAASRAALEQMKSIVGDVNQPAWSKIQRALPNNVTTEMGLALYHLALLEPESAAYREEWKKFVDLYGHRGPEEFDIASARYRDQAQLLHDQIETLRKSAGTTDNPQARFEQAQVERHAAYEELCEQIQKQHGWVQLKRFQALYRVFEHTSGYREMHKYLLIFVFDLLRQRLLRRAEQLVGEGRLDNVEQIFDLTLDDVRQADSDSHYDLRAAGQSNRTFSNRLAAVPGLPSLFDSRGKILRPTPRPPREGEVAGTPISSGVVRGRIKVLHAPDEKPLLRGEILVARATDPGWTPLFVNAAAVILEIGGMLQHGALVAREYGLPCVSGIPNATALWEDGTMVEVDGTAGIIRIVDS